MKSKFGTKSDRYFMRKALAQAQKAFDQGEVPVGGVIVDLQKIIVASSYNSTESMHTQAAHAEIRVIQEAGKIRRNWRFSGCWLYVTLEPCSMCMNLILLSRFEGVVFGAHSPLFGYQLDTTTSLQVYKRGGVQVVEGVCALEAERLLQQFFRERRRKSD